MSARRVEEGAVAMVHQEVVVEADIERSSRSWSDYRRYPEFVPGIKACTRARGRGREARRVRAGPRPAADPLRAAPRGAAPRAACTWSLVSGEILKVSNGSWELSPEGGKTRARYSVDIQIARPPLVPQALLDRMSDQLTRVQLPRTLEAFRARAEGR